MSDSIYKPQAYYFRAAVYAAETRDDLKTIALHAIAELEELHEWMRQHGIKPPQWHFILEPLSPEELRGEMIPLPHADVENFSNRAAPSSAAQSLALPMHPAS